MGVRSKDWNHCQKQDIQTPPSASFLPSEWHLLLDHRLPLWKNRWFQGSPLYRKPQKAKHRE